MRGYKIIQEDGKYSFQLIPRNNNCQCVGWSKQFDSQLECVQGVKQLRNLIVDNQIKTLDSPYVTFIKGEKYTHFEYCVNGEMLFRSREYNSTTKSTCNARVKAIFNQIESYTSKQVY